MTRREKKITAEWRRLERRAAHPGRGEARRTRAALRAYAHSLLASDVGAQQPLMFVPIGSFVPAGWSLVPRQDMKHHHGYSQLVVRDHG